MEAVKSSTGFKFLEARDGNGLWALLYQYPFGTKVFRYNRLGEREYAYACSGYDNCFTDHVLDIDLAHDGRIWAESAGKDQGATFTVSLPIVGM
mgnify:CR=1 FL=1